MVPKIRRDFGSIYINQNLELMVLTHQMKIYTCLSNISGKLKTMWWRDMYMEMHWDTNCYENMFAACTSK
jgi:uncharacterized protein (DUF362 family)